MSRIRPASRTHAKPLIGLYSESGGGKTYSSLLLARGFVGPKGRIGMIETESGRGEAYADVNEYPEIGGYHVLPLRDDFSPKNYGDAIKEFEDEQIDALIIDSGSHEWEGTGGVLDMAAQNEAAGKKGMLIWQKPKIDHQKYFMLKFMQTPIPLVIMNMRAKYPMVGQGAAMKRSEILDPKQSDDILYEMTVHGWMEKDNHNFHPNKRMPLSLQKIFIDGQPITMQTGEKLAEWAKGSDMKPPADPNDPRTIATNIGLMIQRATDAGTLALGWQEFVNDGDIEKVKQASQKAYDDLIKRRDDKLRTFG